MVIKMPENIKPTDPIYSQLKTYYRYGIQIRRITANSLRDETDLRLHDWMQREKIVQFIFPGNHKGHISDSAARRAMQNTFKRAGIANMCPHDLRRSYATDLDRLDVDIRQIQMGMGHKDRKTTEDYIAKLTGSNIDSMYKIKFKDDNKGLR